LPATKKRRGCTLADQKTVSEWCERRGVKQKKKEGGKREGDEAQTR